jgi:hypothetical protein
MSRMWIWLLSLFYLVAALGFAAYEVVQNPFWKLNTGTIGETVGGGLTVYGANALLPVVVWGFVRFRRQAARPVLLRWYHEQFQEMVAGGQLVYYQGYVLL